ncbi:ankyrin repeat protein [Moumouvirus australiensis]|uniref:Ankyrin repeat protein n=1 Tax=Moumouvirus australiensis TaxID=2109587 RepID=A0A2P1EN25_9VIRU|nr:ankyrin repeat protein [Moumouvirus australiensis]AVL95272.1 ankyrin repeat protein [Moumouvirus australiensis]
MSQELYFKITNELECHHGFQYVDGLNILKEEFNNNPNDSCVSGRLYFSDSENICKFLGYGMYLREVFLPIGNPDFLMIKDPEGDKYGANMIILGKRRDLKDLETWKYMFSIGIDIRAKDDYAVRWASGNGHLEVVKYLVGMGADIRSDNDYAVRLASRNGHINIVKYLKKRGVEIKKSSSYKMQVIQIENGIDIKPTISKKLLNEIFSHGYEWKIIQFPSYYDRLKKYVNIN